MHLSREVWAGVEGATASFPLSEDIMVSRAQREEVSPSRDRATLTVGAPGASRVFPKGKGALKEGLDSKAGRKWAASLGETEISGASYASDKQQTLKLLSASQRW